MKRRSVLDGVSVTEASQEQLDSFNRAEKQINDLRVPRLYESNDKNSYIYFALFDGTDNDADDDTKLKTNVGLLRDSFEQAKFEHPNLGFDYLTGPGTQGGIAGRLDAMTGRTYASRIEQMKQRFDSQVASWRDENPNAQISVVAVGFSRGAEQAAGFLRCVNENVTYDLESGEKIVDGKDIPCALGIYDPVGTGEPQNHDRRPTNTTLSALQINAADEKRNLFKSDSIVKQGLSDDGRKLGVTTAGCHANCGGGYALNGLSDRNYNLMGAWINGIVGEKLVQDREVNMAPGNNVIHDSSEHKFFYRTSDERGINIHADPQGRPDPPVDEDMAARFPTTPVHEVLANSSESSIDSRHGPSETHEPEQSELTVPELADSVQTKVIEPDAPAQPEVEPSKAAEPAVDDPEHEVAEPESPEPDVAELFESDEPDEPDEPEVDQAEVSETQSEEPDVAEPELAEPAVEEPEAPEPAVLAPESPEPDVAEPSELDEPDQPEIAEPEAPEPAVEEPESPEPDVAEPELSEPEPDEPEAPEPDVTEPDTPVPVVEEPDVAEPEAPEPAVEEPGVAEPSEPDAPDVAEPDAQEPAVEEPESPEPDVAEPREPDEPDQPEVAEPEAPEPAVEEPESPEPDVAEPSEPDEPNAPEVAEPEAPEPAVDEPESPEPGAVEEPPGVSNSEEAPQGEVAPQEPPGIETQDQPESNDLPPEPPSVDESPEPNDEPPPPQGPGHDI